MLSKLAAQCDLIEAAEDAPRAFAASPPPTRLAAAREPRVHEPPERRAHAAEQPAVHEPRVPRLRLSPLIKRRALRAIAAESRAPLMKRKRAKRDARAADPLAEVAWLNVSPRAQILNEVRKDLPRLFQHVRAKKRRKEDGTESVVLVSPRNVSLSFCLLLLTIVRNTDSWFSTLQYFEHNCLLSMLAYFPMQSVPVENS